MKDEPADLTPEIVAEALRRYWRLYAYDVVYAPVGFGSYHWYATEPAGRRWFVTANDLGQIDFHALRAAFGASWDLRRSGLEFVVAPVPDAAGVLAVRLSEAWCLSLFDCIEGASNAFGEWPDASQRIEAARLIGRLHGTPAPSSLLAWEAALPNGRVLREALDDRTIWPGGPFAEPVRRLLAAYRDEIEAALRLRIELLRQAPPRETWVVTHGEPHAANFVVTADGRLHLIDWDTARLAPRERDVYMVAGRDPEALSAYCDAAGGVSPDAAMLRLFELHWYLADIAVYVRRFGLPHGESDDDMESWQELQDEVSLLRSLI